jgi:Holliday junction resolvasome RuvABC ATP-dependent DNA helicase subunit
MTQPPIRCADIIGQEDSVARLSAFSEFYRKNSSPLEHILIVAEDGMGKRTIGIALANELGLPWQEVNASQLQVKGDFSVILTNLRQSELLIINEIHRLKPPLQKMLLEAMKTYEVTISIGQGAAARLHRMDIQRFTVVGTTLKKSECSEELMSCFSLVLSLRPYSVQALEKIVQRIAAIGDFEIEPEARRLILSNSGHSPLQVEMLIQRVARAVNKQKITLEDTLQAFADFGMRLNADTQTGDLTGLELMSGVEFERLVTALLVRMEFRAEMTKATGDGGIDIVAVLDKPILGGKYLFQCKRYAPDNLVGAATVRDFYGAVTADKAVKGILVTTSDFTAQAREFAERVGLELINFGRLQDLFAQYGMRRSGEHQDLS